MCSPKTVPNILFTGCICYIRATHFNHGLFFFAIRYSAFKVPIGVEYDKTKPVYLLLLLYGTIYEKKSAPNSHFENFDFGSGGARKKRCTHPFLSLRPRAEVPLQRYHVGFVILKAQSKSCLVDEKYAFKSR